MPNDADGAPLAVGIAERRDPDQHHGAGCERAQRRVVPERELVGHGGRDPDDRHGEQDRAVRRAHGDEVVLHDPPTGVQTVEESRDRDVGEEDERERNKAEHRDTPGDRRRPASGARAARRAA